MSRRSYEPDDDMNDLEPSEIGSGIEGNSATEGSNIYLNEQIARAITLSPALESQLWSGMSRGLSSLGTGRNFVGLRNEAFPESIPGVHTYNDARDLLMRGYTGKLLSAAQHIGIQEDDRSDFYEASQALQLGMTEILSNPLQEGDVFGPTLVGRMIGQITTEFHSAGLRRSKERPYSEPGEGIDEGEEADLQVRPSWVRELAGVVGTTNALDWHDRQLGAGEGLFTIEQPKSRLEQFFDMVRREGVVPVGLYSGLSNQIKVRNSAGEFVSQETGTMSQGGELLSLSTKQSSQYPYQVSATSADISAIQEVLADKKRANGPLGRTLRSGISGVIGAQKGYSGAGEDSFDLSAEDNFSYFNMQLDARRSASTVENAAVATSFDANGKPTDDPLKAARVVAGTGLLTGGERVGTVKNGALVQSTETGFPLTATNRLTGQWVTDAPSVNERYDDKSELEANYTLKDVEETIAQVKAGTYNNWFVPEGVKAPAELNSRKLLSDEQMDEYSNLLMQGLNKGGYGSMPRLAYIGEHNDQQYPTGQWRSEYNTADETLRLQRFSQGTWGSVGAVLPAYVKDMKQNEAMVAQAQVEGHYADVQQALDKIHGMPEYVPHEEGAVPEPAAPVLSGAGNTDSRRLSSLPDANAGKPDIPSNVAGFVTPGGGGGENSGFAGAVNSTRHATLNPVGTPQVSTIPAAASSTVSPAQHTASVTNAVQAAAGVIPPARNNPNAAYAHLPAALQNGVSQAEKFEYFSKQGVDNPVDSVNEANLPEFDHNGRLTHDADGRPVYTDRSGNITTSARNVQNGAMLAEEAVKDAFRTVNTQGLDAESLPATIWKSVTTYIRNRLKNELDDQKTGPDAQRELSVAMGTARQSLTGAAKVSNLDPQDLYSGSASTRVRNAAEAQVAMASNPTLAKAVADTGRSLEDLLGDKQGVVLTADDDTNYTFGGGGGGGWGRGGGTGGTGSRMRSPYQQDFGRVMQSVFMGAMAWRETGGAVINEAKAYGQEQAAQIPMLDYGGGTAAGAPAYASQASMAKFNIGQAAYSTWGSTISGMEKLSENQALVGAGQSVLTGIGAGGIAGFAASQIGSYITGLGAAAMAPVAVPIGLAVGAGVFGFTQYEQTKSKDLQNALRGLPAEGPRYEDEFNASVATDALKNYTPQQIAGMQKSLQISDLAKSIATARSLDVNQVQSDIGYATQFTGGIVSAAGNLVDTASTLGESGQQFTNEVNTIASAQGALMGSDQWNQVASKAEAMAAQNPQVYRQWQKQQGQQASYRSSFSRFFNTDNQEASAMRVAGVFGGNITAAQTQALTTRFSSATAAGINITDQYGISAANAIQKYGVAGSNAISSWTQQGGAYSPMAATFGAGFAQLAMNQGASAVDITTQFGQYKGGFALEAMGLAAGYGSYAPDSGVRSGYGANDINDGLVYNPNQGYTSQTQGLMNSLGIFKGDTGMQQAYASGGTYQTAQLERSRQYSYQMASIGVGMAENTWQRQYLWGNDQGGTAQNPTADSYWGLQNQQIGVQWQGTKAQEAYQVASQQNQYAQFEQSKSYNLWNTTFGYQTDVMSRGFERQQYQYNVNTTNLQYGWEQQDIDEQIRRSSGYDRALLERQKGREVLSHNLEIGQMGKEQTNQEKLWARQDQQYQKEIANETAIYALQEKQYSAEKAELERQIKENEDLHKLQKEMIAMERENQEKSLDFQKTSLGIQAAAASETKTYADNMDKLQKNLDTFFGGIDKVASNADAVVKAMQSVYDLRNVRMSVAWSPTGFVISGNGTTQRTIGR